MTSPAPRTSAAAFDAVCSEDNDGLRLDQLNPAMVTEARSFLGDDMAQVVYQYATVLGLAPGELRAGLETALAAAAGEAGAQAEIAAHINGQPWPPAAT